jgi:hypothetical protein
MSEEDNEEELMARAFLNAFAIGFLLCINTSYNPSSVKNKHS